jgi:hypothetical protein
VTDRTTISIEQLTARQKRLTDLIAAAQRAGACEEELDALTSRTPEAVTATASFEYWAHWAYHRMPGAVPEHVRALYHRDEIYGGAAFHNAAREWLLNGEPQPQPQPEPYDAHSAANAAYDADARPREVDKQAPATTLDDLDLAIVPLAKLHSITILGGELQIWTRKST